MATSISTRPCRFSPLARPIKSKILRLVWTSANILAEVGVHVLALIDKILSISRCGAVSFHLWAFARKFEVGPLALAIPDLRTYSRGDCHPLAGREVLAVAKSCDRRNEMPCLPYE